MGKIFVKFEGIFQNINVPIGGKIMTTLMQYINYVCIYYRLTFIMIWVFASHTSFEKNSLS